MAYIKYAGEEAVGRIADYVNKKLAFASSMPESPDANTIVLYVGADTSAYKQGGIYQYDGTEWNLINLVKTIELTQAEYDALPSAAKLNGTIYFVTDGSADGSIISGYYNETDGEFYAEDTYETQYDHHSNTIYIDLPNNTTYIYDFENEEYVQVGGSGSGTVIKYVNTLPVTGIENIIYGIKRYNSFEETIADGFLDENVLFEKEDDLSGGYIYTPAEDVVLDASDDGTTYKGFTSLAYDGTSDWTLTFDDTTDATLADGDTFYFKQPVDKFFAGDATNQKIIPFGSASGSGGDYAQGEGITINNQVISVAPATNSTLGGVKPDDETLKVDGITGTLSGNYEGGFNIKIDGNTISTKTFVGTLEEWNNLTSAQKAKFDTVSITDDGTTPIATPGHEVLDSTDTPLPQRTNIQFEGAEATDDSTNDITKVTITPYTAGDGIEIDDHEVSVTEDRPATFVGTTQEWDALTAAEKAQYKIVNLTNDVTGGETVVVDTIENGNLNPVTSNAVYNFPIDSIVNNSLRPATSNAVRDAIYFLEDSLKYRHIDGTAISPMTSDPSLYYNANSLTMYFSLAAGDYTCNQLYNGNYYARLASFTTSDVNIAFPGATNVAVGSVIMVGRCISNRSDGVYGISLYRYNTSTWYLTSSRLYSSTSGTKVTISATEYLYCPFYGKTSYFGFPEI